MTPGTLSKEEMMRMMHQFGESGKTQSEENIMYTEDGKAVVVRKTTTSKVYTQNVSDPQLDISCNIKESVDPRTENISTITEIIPDSDLSERTTVTRTTKVRKMHMVTNVPENVAHKEFNVNIGDTNTSSQNTQSEINITTQTESSDASPKVSTLHFSSSQREVDVDNETVRTLELPFNFENIAQKHLSDSSKISKSDETTVKTVRFVNQEIIHNVENPENIVVERTTYSDSAQGFQEEYQETHEESDSNTAGVRRIVIRRKIVTDNSSSEPQIYEEIIDESEGGNDNIELETSTKSSRTQ